MRPISLMANAAIREGPTWPGRRPTLVAALLSAAAVAILIVAFGSVSAAAGVGAPR